jgi:hypothetical protein
MVKKFLLSAAVVGALATSAMAYEALSENGGINELNEMVYDTNNSDVNNSAPGTIKLSDSADNTGFIFPVYYAGNGWSTTAKIINTRNFPVIAKVVLYDRTNSKEVIDFNIYLSAHDVADFEIKQEDGKYYLESTDGSIPLEKTTEMASKDKPLKEEISSPVGYIEVIPMVQFNEEEHDKLAIRQNYLQFAEAERLIDANHATIIDGVYRNQTARTPNININNDSNNDRFSGIGALHGALDGYIRITNNVNGTDMVHHPVYFEFNVSDENNTALVYLEREKANMMDIAIDTRDVNNTDVVEYNWTDVNASAYNLSPNTQVYLPFGESSVENMMGIFTIPFKRVYVQTAIDNGVENNVTLFDFNASTDGINDFGSFTYKADIYDEDEGTDAGSSPASDHLFTIVNELQSTGTNPNVNGTLAHYLSEKIDQYPKGYLFITRYSTRHEDHIPGIMTQMLATSPNSNSVVTNWFDPIAR